MNSQIFENIECYVQGDLSGERLKCFENILKNDDIVRERLALYRTINAEMKINTHGDEREKDLRKTLSQLGEKYFEAPRNMDIITLQNTRRKWLMSAAAIFILIIFSYQFLVMHHKSSRVLYAQYMQFPLISSGTGNGNKGLLTNAINAYNLRDFNKALENFNSYLAVDSSNGDLILAKNICLMETGQIYKAIAGFNNLAEEKQAFKYQANWYEALEYLKLDDKNSCKKLLQTIPPASKFYAAAQSLVEKL